MSVGVGLAPKATPGRKRITPQPFVPIHTVPSGPISITSMSFVTSGEPLGVHVTHSVPSTVNLRPHTARPATLSSSRPSMSMSIPPRDVPAHTTPFPSTAIDETQPSFSNIQLDQAPSRNLLMAAAT